MQIQSLVETAAQAVNTALARGASSYPSIDMARDGYVIDPAFLSASDAESAMRDVERFADRSITETGVPGSKLTDRSNRQLRDLNVRVLDNPQHLCPVIQQLAESGRIEETMTRLTGRRMAVGRLTLGTGILAGLERRKNEGEYEARRCTQCDGRATLLVGLGHDRVSQCGEDRTRGEG